MDPTKTAGAVDLDYLRTSKVVGVGVGGALGLYEDLVRSGVEHLVLVDFDRVDHGNLATQGYRVADIDRTKVHVAAAQLRAINPDLRIETIEADFLELDEDSVGALVEDAALLLMMTDNFFAQARGNLVGLKHQVPTIFAIMYERSACAEITFTIPGITPGCHRCAVSSRYAEFERDPGQTTEQTCTTIFHTHYLNSVLGLLSLSILQRDRPGLIFSDWFGQSWERNLIQLRLDPRYGREPGRLFERLFGAIPHAVAFDSVWQRIEAEAPPKYAHCPDCGGGGDLRHPPPITSTLPRRG